MKKYKLSLIRNCVVAAALCLSASASASVGAAAELGNAPYACAQNDDDEVAKYFLVWDNEGGYVSFPLEERPRIVVDYEKSLVRCITRAQEVEFSLNEVHKYTLSYTSENAAVEEVAAEEEGTFSRNSGSLEFENYKPGTIISVYLINGMMVTSQKVDNDGRLSISMLDWEKGIYLIKAGSVTYKIIKK